MIKSKPFTLLIHIALIIIVVGALVTHFFGIQGTLSLNENNAPVDCFVKTSGPGDGHFPFTVSLEKTEILYYPGTTTPMDFRSHILVDGQKRMIAMNSVASVDGWRFYQSGMGVESSTLSVSHDPWGIGITYSGYILLFIGMIGFFFQGKTLWRAKIRKFLPILMIIIAVPVASASESKLPAMQRPLARNFGRLYVYWNDRICPLQTMAQDVTVKLYGGASYKGLTSEQVLSGWLFYYDDWMKDYNSTHPGDISNKKERERRELIQWVGSGAAFRIYPYQTAFGEMEWLSLTERRPSEMTFDQWNFMLSGMKEINDNLLHGKNIAANDAIFELRKGQIKYAGEKNLPSGRRFETEVFYNTYVKLFPAAIVLLIIASGLLFCVVRGIRLPRGCDCLIGILSFVFIGMVLGLRCYISGHLPMASGCEMMLCIGFAASGCAAVLPNKIVRCAALMVAAMALLVAAMAAKTPQIGSLLPVLASPLLSIHVMLVAFSYMLFFLMAILAAIALGSSTEKCKQLADTNYIILIPALFLLTAGIFVGAVWANQSWGRYWGWDPKETCALVTMLVYSLPAHAARIKWFRNPRNMNLYLLPAILSVLFTYFGANYFLPGLHSYA